MAALSNDATLAMLNMQFGHVIPDPPDVYAIAVALKPPTDGNGTDLKEPDFDPDYTRILIANNTSTFAVDVQNLAVVVTSELIWQQSQAAWGPVVGVALYDNDIGTFVSYIDVTPPRQMEAGDTLKIPPGTLRFNIQTTPVSVAVEEFNVPEIFTAPGGDRYYQRIDDSGMVEVVPTEMYGPPTSPLDFDYTDGTFTWTENAFDGGGPDDHFRTSYTLWWSADGLMDFTIIGQDELEFTPPGAALAGVYWLTADNQIGSSSPTDTVTVS